MNLAASVLLDVEHLRQAERALAVDHAEVDRLGHAPHFRRHFLQAALVHLAGHPGVNIFIAFESRPQRFVAGKVGQHAQFDLRIVRRQQRQSGSPGKNAERISRPSSVRIGMFCKFGSLELKRPVAATT